MQGGKPVKVLTFIHHTIVQLCDYSLGIQEYFILPVSEVQITGYLSKCEGGGPTPGTGHKCK